MVTQAFGLPRWAAGPEGTWWPTNGHGTVPAGFQPRDRENSGVSVAGRWPARRRSQARQTGALACLLMAACEPLSAACVIGGTVRDADSMKPLAHARVFAKPYADAPAILRVTDAEGAFCFEQLAPNTYEIVAEKAGYLVLLYGARPGSDDGIPLEVGAQAKIPPLTLRMLAGATLAGTALDPDGQPVAAIVELTRKIWDKRWTGEFLERAVSGEDGAFRFSTLAPGAYYLKVFPARSNSGPWTLDAQGHPLQRTEAETFYAGSYTLAHATPIPLKAGQQKTDVVVAIQRPAWRHFSGRLSPDLVTAAAAHAPVQMQLSFEDGMSPVDVIVPADGAFSAEGLAPGEYTFNVFGFEPGASGSVDLSESDVDGFVIEAPHVVSFQASVRIEGGGTAPARLWAVGRDVDESMTEREEGGIYRFHLPAGVYGFQAQEPDRVSDLYVKRILVEGRPQPEPWLDLRHNPPAKVELVLARNSAGIEGRLDLRPGETHDWAITVVAVDETRSATDLKFESTVADQTGEFDLGDLAPGKWRVLAIEGFQEGLWGSPELLDALREKSVEMDLPEGRTSTVKLPLIGAEEWEAALRKVGM